MSLDALTKSLVDVYAKKCSDQQRIELLEALDVIARDAKYNVFRNTFPDTGTYSIHAYAKFKEMFDATGKYDECAAISGNRTGKCVTYQTLIDLADGSVEKAGVLFERGEPFQVFAWDESLQKKVIATAGTFFQKKPKEDCVKLYMSSGRIIECALNHRVLTSTGWQFVSQGVDSSNLEENQHSGSGGLLYLLKHQAFLRSASSLKSLLQRVKQVARGLQEFVVVAGKNCLDFSCLVKSWLLRKLSSLDASPSARMQGDLCSPETTPNYLSSYFEHSRPCDVQPHFFGDTVQDVFPLPVYARQRPFVAYKMDDQGNRCTSNQQSASFPHSILGVALQPLAQTVVSLYHIACKRFSESHRLLQEALLPALVEACLLLPFFVTGLHRFRSSSFVTSVSSTDKIIAYKLIGSNDCFDFQVDIYHNYITSGMVHHNTVAGSFATTCHSTGIYPDWWTGKRYHKPTMIWVGGDTSLTCRDILQFKLLGDIGDFGSGMIPKDLIVETKTRRNVADAIETIRVRHISGGVSTIVLKTYEQGRAAWQGTEIDFIWIDEECPQDVYGEAVKRLMTTKGTIMLTFTPLSGLTDLVVDFLDNDQFSEAEYPKYVAKVSWYDVPHLGPAEIAKELARTPENMKAARSMGDPTVGSGLIFPLPLDMVTVEDFMIPKYFAKAYGFDVGWKATAATFGAWDRDNDIMYITSEYKQGMADYTVHASAIRARGAWMRGAIDPGARISGQRDGEKLFMDYVKPVDQGGGGLKLILAMNAVEAGIFNVWDRLQSGRLKIFKSCTQLQREYGLYHRNDDGKVVKSNDHLLDAMRYLVVSDKSIWRTIEAEGANRNQNVIEMRSRMNACM